MPSLTDIWAQVAVDPYGLLTVLAELTAALVLGRLLAGGLDELPVYSRAERWLIWILLGCVAFSWVGTVLAALGLFRWWTVLAGLVVFVVAALWARRAPRSSGRVSPPPLRQTPKLAVVGILTLVGMAVWLFARPAESLFLVDDSAVYTIGGIALARDGGLLARPAAFWPVTADFARLFYTHNLSGTVSRFYGPFYQYFLSEPVLEIGFLPLPKVWSALAVWFLGPARATGSTPVFGVLGLASLYGLVRRTVSWQAALIATLLLGISLPQIWMARYPIPEMYAQATILGASYLAVLARQNRADLALSRALVFWSAACLGLWTIVRLESAVLVPLLAVLLMLAWGRTAWLAQGYARLWLVVLALFSAIGLVISLAVSRFYLFDQILGILSPRAAQLAVYATLLLLLGGLIAWRTRQYCAKAVQEWDLRVSRRLPTVVAVIWLVWALLGLSTLLKGDFANKVPGWLAFYLSPLGVVLAIGGILWLAWQQHRGDCDRPELMVLLAAGGILLIVYSINPLVARGQPWAVRRLVPMILPIFALASGALLASALQRPARHKGGNSRAWIGFGIGVCCVLAQIFLEARTSLPILLHRELRGYAAQLQVIAETLPTDALLLFDNGLTALGLPQAFELVFGHPALPLQRTPSGEAETALDALIEKALSEQRPVFFVATDGDLAWWPAKWDLISKGVQRIDTVVLRRPQGRAPRAEDIVRRAFIMDFYEIRAHTTNQPAPVPILTAGAGSYPFLRNGFYGWGEGVDDRIVRWTDGDALVALPWPSEDLSQDADLCLQIDVAGGRPAAEPPAQLAIEVEGVPVFDGELPKDFAPHEIRVSAQQIRNTHLDELELRLISTTWNASGAGDNRVLGVLFYGLRFLPIDACVPH
jgi:hypothetical protein